MEKNILVLSAGRRVELVERFKAAAKRLNIRSKIVAVDITDTAPAVHFADGFYLVPRISEDTYVSSIIEVCNKENIALIIPTIDTELLKLSHYRNEIEISTKAKILLSSDRVIKICRDKHSTQEFFEEFKFEVPREISHSEITEGKYGFPLFIKPEDGSSSINAFKVKNKKELEFFMQYIEKPIVQEYIEGIEYSVDVFCDFDSNPITIVPRIRLATRSGEISKGRIDKNREIIDDVKRMIEILKPIGHITVQCMKTKKGIEYIEINPRFGGGAPMSIDAGADSCENLYRLLEGEKLTYNEKYKDKMTFVRFDKSIMLTENMELIR